MRISAGDVLAVIGFAVLVYGVWLLSAPGAFILAGLVIAACGCFASIAHGSRRGPGSQGG